ncbi:MAG: Asp-tRNA(Asn)/Glu-tRNA(Gln) amidotransferase subunit GatC [Ferruginibacter sp.]|jgi:aspartyl-tRNA(Asn)/glutamyl-tRNA(Gln) amidotransferase subunit C
MEINDAMIDKLARLSMLDFTDQQKTAIRNDLEKMIGFVDKLNELDTTGVEPLMHINPVVNVFRADETNRSYGHSRAMHNAPDHEQGFFTVPKVIKK